MATIDITLCNNTTINQIDFLQDALRSHSTLFAKSIIQNDDMGCEIHDGGAYVIIANKDHAKYLIRALDKAIELGWLE